jgi:uncharacterized repeat protein (TIGR03803 family)
VIKVSPGGTLSTLADLGNSNLVDDAHVTVITPDGGEIGFFNGSGSELFKLSPSAQLTSLHSWPFPMVSPDGFNVSVAVLGQDGLIYGYVTGGGAHGYGNLFRIAQDGSGFTVLHSFTAAEGQPLALLQSADGSWYGSSGHVTTENPAISGTVFRFDAGSGKLSPLHTTPTGTNPSSLILDRDGRLYGAIVSYVGAASFPTQIFSMAIDGSGYQQGQTLPVSASGSDDHMQLVQAADGRVFGYVYDGGRGPSNGTGAIYEVNSQLGVRQVFTFQGFHANLPGNKTGTWPDAMVLGDDGNFYGAAINGGTGNGKNSGCGAIFEYQPPAN